MTASDAPSIRAAFDRLSAESLRHRFFTPIHRLTPGITADLTLVDEGRLVLVALDADGAVVGEARAVRHRDDPSMADVAVTVADDHQRQGLGTKLLRRLRADARRAGIDRLTGHVLVDNVAGQALLVASRAVCWVDEPGVIAFEIPLGRRTVSPRVAARRTLGPIS